MISYLVTVSFHRYAQTFIHFSYIGYNFLFTADRAWHFLEKKTL